MQTTNKFIKPKRNYKSSVSYCEPVILSRESLHRTYPGRIYEGDFSLAYNECHTMTGVTDSIVQNFRFDFYCENSEKKNIENKNRMKNKQNE